ncbi:UDP-N-acetylmuramoyl-L-alanyl-D-glutamate--2,6-diaminopimelate ligase [Syntrophomonas erecta]
MLLAELTVNIEYKILKGSLNQAINSVCYDSRQAGQGSLFVCIRGLKTDGHQFVDQAISRGATAILAEREVLVPEEVALIITPDTRKALPIVSGNFYNNPSRQLTVIGITGTNGKTTTSHLLQAILEENGEKTGILGTLYGSIGDLRIKNPHTTPESLEIEEFMDLVHKNKGHNVVMEVSSHALALHRVDAIDFDVAVFTNLTQDHLDYHRTMEDYREAKKKLFAMLPAEGSAFAVINADDDNSAAIISACRCRILTFGVNSPADIRAINLDISMQGSRFEVNYGDISFPIEMKLIGLFSVYNALAAISVCLGMNIPIPVIQKALAKVKGVPGRFEQVDCGQDFTVVVDYAHTPDGLENILKTARQLVTNRLITVFGCGGDRDHTKRPLMGEIAARYSDFSVVTSDNPRSEDPHKIIEDILPGLQKVAGARFAVITDRRSAIEQAIYLARPGDLVVIAGKGHETYQLVKDQVLEFDDRQVAAEFLKGKQD